MGARAARVLLGRASRILLPERLIDAVDQGLPVKRLAEDTDCTRGQRALTPAAVWKGSNENDGNSMALGNQEILQLDSVHPRHLDVSNQAGRMIEVRRAQKFFRRRKRVSNKPVQSDELRRGDANGLVVIDD